MYEQSCHSVYMSAYMCMLAEVKKPRDVFTWGEARRLVIAGHTSGRASCLDVGEEKKRNVLIVNLDQRSATAKRGATQLRSAEKHFYLSHTTEGWLSIAYQQIVLQIFLRCFACIFIEYCTRLAYQKVRFVRNTVLSFFRAKAVISTDMI